MNIKSSAVKMPIQITAHISWEELLSFLAMHQDQVTLKVFKRDNFKQISPEEETILLRSTEIYTERFIQQNENVKKNIKKTEIVCNSIKELQKSLMKSES